MATHIGSCPTLEEAQNVFQKEALGAGATLVKYPLNYARGYHNENLSIDVAVFGSDKATRVLVVDIGLHGVEAFGGFLGLLAFLRYLRRYRCGMPEDVRIILIFPSNPYGVSWRRRVNGNNVDLSRNFRQFPLQNDECRCHPHYERLNDVINPASIHGMPLVIQRMHIVSFVVRESAGKIFRCLFSGDIQNARSWKTWKHGWRRFKRAVAMGQYKYPSGMQYGGDSIQPENFVLRTIIQRKVPKEARQLAWVHGHIGLGEWGKPLIITECERDEPMFQRCRAWFGDAMCIESSHDAYALSTAVPGMGAIEHAIEEEVSRIAPECEVTAFCLEVGTCSLWRLGSAVHADNWLHAHGDPYSPDGQQIKEEMIETHYPGDRAWRTACRKAYLRVFRDTLRGLTAGMPAVQ